MTTGPAGRASEACISNPQFQAPPVGNPLPKSLFGYDVVARLGEGAHSTIYSVTDRKTRQAYALKHVVPTDPKHKRFVEQIENEFAVSKLFRHPGLRKSFDLKIRKKLFGGIIEVALVMELVEGVSIYDEVPADMPVILDVFMQTGVALAAVHHVRYIHCDLKPANILRLANGRVKLIDFGQACREGTTKARVQGTPDFIAPEQVRLKPVSYYTDVYNYAATFYWALTGQKVPTLFTVHKTERDVVREQKFPKPHELNPQVPAAVSELVMDCLKLKPAYRPQTIAEVLQRLEPFVPKGAG